MRYLSISKLIIICLIPQLAYSSVSADCNFNTSNYLQELSELKSIKKIEIHIPKHKKWTKNLMKATFKDGPILEKYKKKFEANIRTYYEFGSCIHQGKVRLHGDWKDHIDFLEGGKFIQSLDISLESGAIANFVKFKLLLPKTRNGSSEIIFTHLLRNLKFLAPKTSFVDVEVNGQTSLMLIQEKTEKELLESMDVKEGPLFEGDESYLFSNYRNYTHYDLIDISLSKMTNMQWANSSYESASISLSAFSKLQNIYMDFAETGLENNYALDWMSLSNGNDLLLSKWAKYEILLFAAQASHGLLPHNRKFYFNSFYSAFEPIYYDGGPRSLVGEWIRIRPKFEYYPYLQENHFDELIDLLDNINTSNFISSMQEENILSDQLAKKILQDLSSKINILKNEFNDYKESLSQKNSGNSFSAKRSLSTFKNNLKELLPESIVLQIDADPSSDKFFNTRMCTISKNNCTNKFLPFSDLGNLLEKKVLNKDINNSFPTLFIVPSLKPNFQKIDNRYFANRSIHIQSSSSTTILFDSKQKILEIQLNNPEDWALFLNSTLEDIEIKTSSNFLKKTSYIPDEKKINARGLSGCISFYNSSFKRTKITSKHDTDSCEDTINIINSVGNISEIKIIGSLSDGLDIDFSNISIDSLIINNVGNDCADFSKGKYVLGSVHLSNCGDKGISIGEQSTILIQDLHVKNSKIGIASKDSSISSVQKAQISNADACLDVFQKKQEFFGSILSLDEYQCDSTKVFKDTNSNIFYNEL
ncbi:hypothetical protein N9556_00470 [bacterium]|nr:hypothetical protein [bacterium]